MNPSRCMFGIVGTVDLIVRFRIPDNVLCSTTYEDSLLVRRFSIVARFRCSVRI